MASDGKTIAKNTLFLYVRMFVTMIISLFTSRVVLQMLGVDDYGIYQAVGGIVGFLSFLNSALSGGTSRFLTYELGTGNKEKLKNTFSTTLSVHIIIALLVVTLGETVGLWYFNNKMVIPEDRLHAATIVYHLSMITAIISIISVPFNASIIAHEKMKVFAYVGLIEAVCKLGIAYALMIGTIDRLVLYAVLLLSVQLGIFLFYFFYCRHNYEEAKYKFMFIDKALFREIFSFSGWSLITGSSIALNSQGILLLLNLFFAPAVVTARSISLQVYSVANQFVNNFRTAANPQIVKQLAAGDVEGSHNLLLQSTKFSYYMMFILCLPICLLASPLLHLWLVEVPEYSVQFLQLVVIQSLFSVYDTSLYTALYAKGRIKENALISTTVGFVRFPIVYLLFKLGCSPLALSWTSIATSFLLGFVIKPTLIVKYAEYKWKDIFSIMRTCLIVTAVAVPIPLVSYLLLNVEDNLWHAAIVLVVSVSCVAVSVWFIGLTVSMKQMLLDAVESKLHIKIKKRLV